MIERRTIWIDLENTPHVPFFIPIIAELRSNGFEVILTARDFAQTKALIERAGLEAKIIGREHGSSTLRKATGIIYRAVALARYMKGKHISLAVGHGSRGLLLASKLLHIPSFTLYDYEGASVRLFNRLSSFVMTPEVIPFSTLEGLGLTAEKHLTYPGLKEDVYVRDFVPDNVLKEELGLDAQRVIITIRPPSATAHYRSNESLLLFEGILNILVSRTDIQVILMPRNSEQRKKLVAIIPNSSFLIPERAVDGLNVLYHSDLVIGGGGTMNREAAVLRVPVISIFKGPEGAVDKWLIEQGKMIAIERAEDIIPLLRKRDKAPFSLTNATKIAIVNAITNIVESE